ncbi:hypothetical protein EW145_g2939 [Phellinidium pouzarii]|uniref:Uncharacterized protein n=1 Tax=Phellinidium pouzarii TaxID=167371 RepID=A0A4S4L9G8_9AGAM|nr:hypothetical protein EW145_g2939 [Phellinidium pouzarii]
MAVKRKFDAELDDTSVHCQVVKQMKLVPFPSSEQSIDMDMDMDMDVAMSDAPLVDIDSVHLAFHSRLPSSASSDYSSDTSSPVYPIFDLYPVSFPFSRGSPPASAPASTLNFTHQSRLRLRLILEYDNCLFNASKSSFIATVNNSDIRPRFDKFRLTKHLPTPDITTSANTIPNNSD